MLAELHDITYPRCISDLPRRAFQIEERKEIGGEERAYSLKDAILLPDRHLGQGKKDAVHNVLQVLARDPLSSSFRADQIPIPHFYILIDVAQSYIRPVGSAID